MKNITSHQKNRFLACFFVVLGIFISLPAQATSHFQIDTAGTLMTSLVSYWKLDEETGALIDLPGENDLAPNEYVYEHDPGVVGLAQTFPPWGGVAWIVDNEDLSIGGYSSFTFAFWLQITDIPLSGHRSVPICKINIADDDAYEYCIYYLYDPIEVHILLRNDENTAWTDYITPFNPDIDEWYFVIFDYDGITDTAGISFNNGTRNYDTDVGGVFDGIGKFSLGATELSTGVWTWHMGGYMDEVGFWKKILSTQEKADLYNGGAGQTLEEGPAESNISITDPISGSTVESAFTLEFNYDLLGEDWDKLLIIFESWAGTTSCPIYGTETWEIEYQAGWFHRQSLPYFSDDLITESGSSTIDVYDLYEPYLYNCVRCQFINEETGTFSDEKCGSYTVDISGYLSPGQPLPGDLWQDYYSDHSDPKFATSTEIFTNIAGTFGGLVARLTSFFSDTKNLFNAQDAYAQGVSLGSKIPIARGYVKPINDFFGSMPISELFIFSFLILLIIGIYRLIKTVIMFIRG
jgi:hypothetical protein